MRIMFFAIMFILISCQAKKEFPKDVLQPNQMQSVLWEILKADALAEELAGADTTKKLLSEQIRLQKEVFAIYHITKDDFYRSYNYYVKNNEQMKRMLDSMIVKIDTIKVSVNREPFRKKRIDSTKIL